MWICYCSWTIDILLSLISYCHKSGDLAWHSLHQIFTLTSFFLRKLRFVKYETLECITPYISHVYLFVYHSVYASCLFFSPCRVLLPVQGHREWEYHHVFHHSRHNHAAVPDDTGRVQGRNTLIYLYLYKYSNSSSHFYFLSATSIFVGHLDHSTQQTCDVDPTLVYCWSTVYDVGPTVNQRWANVSSLPV